MMAQLQVVQVLWKPEQLGLCGVVGRGLLRGGLGRSLGRGHPGVWMLGPEAVARHGGW